MALLAATWTVLANSQFNARVALEGARALVEDGRNPTDPTVQALVRDALSRDLTQPAALELTALAVEGTGDRAAAARLYGLSDRISRRSLATRLWLIQDDVSGGNVAGTLANMDIALRTSTTASRFVFPALARGLEEPKLVVPIAAMVDRPSEWREGFLIYAADNADPSSAAALFLASRNRDIVSKDELDRKLVIRLADVGKFALARQLDAAFAPQSPSTQLLADGDFASVATRYPFGWGLTEKSELGASLEFENGHAVLAYHANPAEGGQAAAQLLTLAPGSYTLETQTGRAEKSETSPTWTLFCAGDLRAVVTLDLSPRQHTRTVAPFSIPAPCPGQWLVMTIHPTLSPQSGSVDSVSIIGRPASQAKAE